MEEMNFPFISSELWLKSLADKGYLLNINGNLTLTKKAERLFNGGEGLTEENFDELFNLYPSQSPNGRILHSKNKEALGEPTRDYAMCYKKYSAKIKTIESHEEVIKATKTLLFDHKKRGSLDYLQKLETYINQCGWERYLDVSPLELSGNDNIERL